MIIIDKCNVCNHILKFKIYDTQKIRCCNCNTVIVYTASKTIHLGTNNV